MLRTMMVVLAALCVLLPKVSGQAATPYAVSRTTWSEAELRSWDEQLSQLIPGVRQLHVKQYLGQLRDRARRLQAAAQIAANDGQTLQQDIANAVKLAADVQAVGDSAPWATTPFVCYTVPALSPLQRRPDSLPEDGVVSDRLRIIAAQGEFEPASFVIAPLSDVKSLTLTASVLQGRQGTIPAESVDIRVVKCWYQNGTAWYSYFQDKTRRVLVPELLLHDESLVRVDPKDQENYLRVDYPEGAKYVGISDNPIKPFDHFAEPVADSPTLLPVALTSGEAKQLWLTVKVPRGTAAGIYTGTIALVADGRPAGAMKLTVRVLPFELPRPKTYYDLNKDFYVMLYHHCKLQTHLRDTKGDTQLAETKLLAEYRNLAEHNVINLPGPRYAPERKEVFLRQLEIMEQAGLSTRPLFGVFHTFPEYGWMMNRDKPEYRAVAESFKQQMDEAFDFVEKAMGHRDFYFDGWDEAGQSVLDAQQEFWQYLKDKGGKVYATGHGGHLNLPVKEDFLNWPGVPTRERAAQVHAQGTSYLTNYATPHTGPENPDLMRQRHGMWLYKANYDATYNYIYYEGSNIWNDNSMNTFRNFNLVYPTQTDVIDTIAWEGFREGIDDVRYATKLKQLAADATASGKPDLVAAAQGAVHWLEAVDEHTANPDVLRLEMIRHILRLHDLLCKE